MKSKTVPTSPTTFFLAYKPISLKQNNLKFAEDYDVIIIFLFAVTIAPSGCRSRYLKIISAISYGLFRNLFSASSTHVIFYEIQLKSLLVALLANFYCFLKVIRFIFNNLTCKCDYRYVMFHIFLIVMVSRYCFKILSHFGFPSNLSRMCSRPIAENALTFIISRAGFYKWRSLGDGYKRAQARDQWWADNSSCTDWRPLVIQDEYIISLQATADHYAANNSTYTQLFPKMVEQ